MALDCMYMSLSVAYDSPGQSFEEVRIHDYLQSYHSTGRPPPPCPPLPADNSARARAGLPPLFKPTLESKLTALSNASAAATQSVTTRTTDPKSLPPAQVFVPTKVEGDEFQSICAMTMFGGFSHEELRIYAYLLNNKFSPTPINISPFVVAPHSAPIVISAASTLFSTSGSNTANSINLPQTNGDIMVSISAQSAYVGHSPEELRIAYLRAQRELTSAEIFDLARTAGTLPAPSSSLAPSSNLLATSTSTPTSSINPLIPQPQPGVFALGQPQASNPFALPGVNPFTKKMF
ncbi:hypothetical protein C0991_004015 [Blastosporella zonata]|nr:hypothetical protein C0991_004015 [Blastosporella zonata]